MKDIKMEDRRIKVRRECGQEDRGEENENKRMKDRIEDKKQGIGQNRGQKTTRAK